LCEVGLTASSIIEQGLVEVLCCPACKGGLEASGVEGVECLTCGRRYPVKDGILVLMGDDGVVRQPEELSMRERVADAYHGATPEETMKIVSLHHSTPVMSRRAKAFRSTIGRPGWVLDVGSGTGYYWAGTSGGKLILIDFAFGNLKAAQLLLGGQGDILFVQADASRLPVKDASLAGIWSVQVTQHFPDAVMAPFLEEVKRVLKQRFLVQVYNLNPAPLHRAVYRLLGKRLHVKGWQKEMLLNRLSGKELAALWRKVLPTGAVTIGYSELFFHPDLHMRLDGSLARLLETLLSRLPLVARFFARQTQITLSSLTP
jgi:ubiquinone/menaquinone biosynthesis C-methylase UbiE/uncharacterized protein YbaR (Trm112 family)